VIGGLEGAEMEELGLGGLGISFDFFSFSFSFFPLKE